MKEKRNSFLTIVRNHKKAAIIISAVAAAILIGGFFIAGLIRKKAGVEGVTVAEATASTGNISNTIEGDGNLKAAESAVITLPEGVSVKTWYVKAGDKISEGDKIAELEKESVTSVLATIDNEMDQVEDALDESGLTENETANLNNQKTTLTAMQNKLSKYLDDPVVKAAAGGVVASTASTEESQNNESNQSNKTLVSLDYTTGTASQGFVYLTADAEEETDTTITDFSGLSITAPATGEIPQTALNETSQFSGTISWNPSDSVFAEKTVYKALVSLYPKEGYCFSAAYLPTAGGAQVNGSVDGSGVMNLTITFPETQGGSDDSGSDSGKSDESSSGGSPSQKGDTGSQDKNASSSGNNVGSGKVSGGGSGILVSGDSSAGSAAAGSTSSSGVSIISEAELYTIEQSDSMVVSINVDEMDIISVEEGQEAVVTVDALDKNYTGNVTRISYEPSSSSSNVKYEVDISVESDENMRIGMSASASIVLSGAENVVILPMDALQQEGNELFVYTKKDGKDNLSGKVTVKTGLSDGANVEIKEGLSDGDKVYYKKISGGSGSSGNGSGFDMGGFPGGGSMPSGGFPGGGEMPSGEKPDFSPPSN